MDAYEACRHLVKEIGHRWIGSEGEGRAGDWIERELKALGYETRRLWFDCPAWDYRGARLSVAGEAVEAGAQMFSPGCDVTGRLAVVEPDGKGGFSGEVAGKVALFEEKKTGGVLSRGKLARALKRAGALAAVVVSSLPETWSTKMIRDPEAGLPAVGVSARTGGRLLRETDAEAALVIDATATPGKTSVVIGEAGPEDAPVTLIGAHYDAAPYSVGARDNAAGVGVMMDLAGRFSNADLPHRLRLCGFSGHEFGGSDAKPFGSKSYVHTHPDELTNVALMFNLDGVGGRGSRPLLAVYGNEALLARVKHVVTPMSDVVVEAATGGGSDQGVFVEAGIAAVWLREEGPDDYHRTAYHSPLDDLRWVGRAEIARSAEVAFRLLNGLMHASES